MDLTTIDVQFPPGVYADVRLERVARTDIAIRDGELEDARVRVEIGALLRVLVDGAWYYASTTDLDSVDAQLAELAASSALGRGVQAGVAERLEPHVASQRAFDGARAEDTPMSEKVALLRRHVGLLDRPDVRTWSASWKALHRDRRFLSSRGADVSHDYQELGYSYAFSMVAGEETLNERFMRGATTISALAASADAHAEERAAHLTRCARFVAEAEPVEAGVYPVILSPKVAGVFAHESFGHKSEADFMLGDPSMLEARKIGTKVGSDILSIVDGGAHHGSGYVPWDDEGQPTRETWLIRDGVLTGRLHAAYTADALGEDLTGNARAMNFRFEPIVRMSTTWIAPGDQTRAQLFAGVKDGFYIETFKHGSGMSTFTIAPSLAWRIRDGEIAEPARVAVITGTVFDTLGEIDGLSDTVEIDFLVGGGCGKLEQYPLPVAFGGPYVRIAKMQVA